MPSSTHQNEAVTSETFNIRMSMKRFENAFYDGIKPCFEEMHGGVLATVNLNKAATESDSLSNFPSY